MLSRVHLAFHARIQDFRQGDPGQSDKKALTTFFFTEVKWLISKKGSNIFQGGGGGGGGGGSNFFQGSNCLYPIETHITCDFPGGPDPLTPLWIRTCYLDQHGDSFFPFSRRWVVFFSFI